MKLKLPIDDHLPQVIHLLKTHAHLVMIAEPGAGKTTRLPPALIAADGGQVLVLEPRRVAAIAAAARIAQENNWQLGQEVGYQVRFDNRSQKNTRLIFMTEALLLRRLISDPDLQDVSYVVLDEFHERSLYVDLALGILRELQDLGHPIKIVVMSATLDAENISAYLHNAPIVHVPGQLHPLEILYLDKGLRPVLDQNFYDTLSKKIMSVATARPGHTLVFLPGVGEIERTKKLIEGWATQNKIHIDVLHGSLSIEDQNQVLKPTTERRIILSTNVAESSVTLDGVDTVIDSGLAKVMRHDFNTGFSRLELTRISLSNAAQRAGRSARQAPGVCHRLWTRFDETTMKKHAAAEIESQDLTEALLFLAASGVTQFHQFSWYQAPKAAHVAAARNNLLSLQALDSSGRITEHGRLLLQLPCPPNWAHFLILCARHGLLTLGARAAALLQEREILYDPRELQNLHDPQENDLLYRLECLDQFERHKNDRSVKVAVAKRVLQSAKNFIEIIKRLEIKESPQMHLTLDEVICLSFPQHLCRRREKTERARMVGGRGIRLAPESLVKSQEFFIALQAIELGTSADTLVNMAYSLDKATLNKIFSNEIQETEELVFNTEKGQLYSVKQKKFRDLPLEEGRPSLAPAAQSQEQLCQFLLENPDFVYKKNPDLENWMQRWAAYCRTLTEAQASDIYTQEVWQMACLGARNLDEVLNKNLIPYFETQLSREALNNFHQQAPQHFTAPTGSQFKIIYPNDRPPYVEIRLQELFGVKTNPLLLNDTTPLQIHLLGPNYRPVQVTSDLASFWRNTYPEVRKELRSRYPKHSWPEDPTTAPPVRKGQSQRRS